WLVGANTASGSKLVRRSMGAWAWEPSSLLATAVAAGAGAAARSISAAPASIATSTVSPSSTTVSVTTRVTSTDWVLSPKDSGLTRMMEERPYRLSIQLHGAV